MANKLFSKLGNFFSRPARSTRLAARVVDDNIFFGNNASTYYRDRLEYNREKVLDECLRAWRVNPVARSIVRTCTAFVVGHGIEITSEHKGTNKFLAEWSGHRLNRLEKQFKRWSDELVRSGNLFFLFTVDPNTGMSYVRAVPADQIKDIQPAPNDVEQEKFYVPVDLLASPWPAWDPAGEQSEFMVHFAANCPVGVNWGEPDLAPMLPWIGRLSSLIEDRVRLNRFRNAFLYVVRGKFTNAAEKQRRQAELNANPPQPGTILVTDEGEDWGIMAPQLDSFDASVDILAVKKFIAAGINFPLHWLAEPESSTRSTAEAAGTPTFRNLENMQGDFCAMIEDLAHIALIVRKKYDRRIKVDAEIRVMGPDITERDNSALALAVNRLYPALVDLYDRKLIDEKELMRLIYRMAGEPIDLADIGKGIRKDPRQQPAAGGTKSETDPGEPTDPEEPK